MHYAKIAISLLTLGVSAEAYQARSPERSLIEQLNQVLPAVRSATTISQDCQPQTPRPHTSAPNRIVLPRLEDKPHLFDTVFLFDAYKIQDAVQISGHSFGNLIGAQQLTGQQLVTVTELYLAAPGKDTETSFTTARSRQESLSLIRENAANLSVNQKLVFLSLLGDTGLSIYDNAMGMPHEIPEDQIWEGMRTNTAQGGRCGNLHTFYAEYAKALGFDSVGPHSGLWTAQGDSNQGGAHVIYHFRDPNTGEYYVQNYGGIINTHQKTQQATLDVSERIFGPLSTSMYTQSQRNDGSTRVHLYRPRTSRWVAQVLEESSRIRNQRADVHMTIGNREQTFVGGYQPGGTNGNTRVFAFHSNYNSTDGQNIQLSGFGVSGRVQKSTQNRLFVDEAKIAAQGMFGLNHIGTPAINPHEPATRNSRTNMFAGGQITGTARINNITGKLEMRINQTDFRGFEMDKNLNASTPYNEIQAGAKYERGRIRTGAARTWQIAPDTLSAQNPRVQTTADTFDLVFDTTGEKTKVAIKSHTQLLVLEGVENMSAVGIRERLELAIPTERRGTITVIGDASKVFNNRKDDPFYKTPSAAELTANWRKSIREAVEVGASGTLATKSQPFYMFEDKSGVRPDLGPRPRTRAEVYARIKW